MLLKYREREITKEGDVVCDVCGDYLGNIYNDDFFSLIRKKYCPKHQADARRFTNSEAQRARRKRLREERKLIKDQNELLKEENEILRRTLIEYRRKAQ